MSLHSVDEPGAICNGSTVLQCFKHSNAIELRNRILFDFVWLCDIYVKKDTRLSLIHVISSNRLKLGGDLGTRLHSLNTPLQFNGLLHHKNNISECHAYHSPLLTWIMETNSFLKLPVTSLSSSRLNSGGEERGREGRRGERKVEVKGQYWRKNGNSGVRYVWKMSQSTRSWIFKYLT